MKRLLKPGAALILVVAAGVCILLIYNLRQDDVMQPGVSFRETRLFFDTICTITVYGFGNADDAGDDDAGESALAAIVGEAFKLCEEYEALLSMTVDNSDIRKINHAEGEAVIVAPATVDIILSSLEFGNLTDGMFDVTVGRLSRLWDFTSPGRVRAVPAEDEIEKAQGAVGYRQVEIDAENNSVKLQNPAAWLDLGGIAKGYIGDKVAGYLAAQGIESALIDLGGDIVALGGKPDGSPWRLGVRRPFGGMEEYIGVLEASGVAVVSSGVYERQFEQDGVLYHHIIDPETGYPAESDIVSATVIAEDAVTGECLSTTAVIAGSSRIGAIFDKTPGFIGAVLVLDNFEVLTYGEAEMKG